VHPGSFMPQKIFISYRRQDSSANVLGIAQYLEHEFGRKNVFVDVDMRAGSNFPAVLEQRLAECKVMLVLIGANWIDARGEHGQRRLDDADDWVRLEIAHALKRNITVIPVRIDGAPLPSKAMLPDDIKGLFSHQAATVTLAGFRHEMAGLVRDIQAIPSPRPWKLYCAYVATALLLLVGVAVFALRWHAVLHYFSSSPADDQNGIWSSRPGDWVMFAVDKAPLAYYFRPSSVRVFGDKVAYDARYPLKSTVPVSSETPLTQGVYEDNLAVIDCKKSTWKIAEYTIYNRTGETISHFKAGSPETLDLSTADPVGSGSILSIAQRMLCGNAITTPLLSKEQLSKLSSAALGEIPLTYLAVSGTGDSDLFYGEAHSTELSDFPRETIVVARFRGAQDFSTLAAPGQNVIGTPRQYLSFAEALQFNCSTRKMQIPRTDYYDPDGNWAYLLEAIEPQQLDPKEGSPFGTLLNVQCRESHSKYGGPYEGTNNTTYKKGGEGQSKVSISVAQNGDDIEVTFKTASGGQGSGTGKLAGATAPIAFQSTTPNCPGSYHGSITFSDTGLSWTYEGEDCGGPMEGHGTANKTRP
jgi:hypothetical protein